MIRIDVARYLQALQRVRDLAGAVCGAARGGHLRGVLHAGHGSHPAIACRTAQHPASRAVQADSLVFTPIRASAIGLGCPVSRARGSSLGRADLDSGRFVPWASPAAWRKHRLRAAGVSLHSPSAADRRKRARHVSLYDGRRRNQRKTELNSTTGVLRPRALKLGEDRSVRSRQCRAAQSDHRENSPHAPPQSTHKRGPTIWPCAPLGPAQAKTRGTSLAPDGRRHHTHGGGAKLRQDHDRRQAGWQGRPLTEQGALKQRRSSRNR